MMSVAMIVNTFGWDYIQKLRANGAKMGAGSGQVVDDTASGDFKASLAPDYIAIDKIQKGATMGIVFPKEMLVVPSPIAIFKGTPNLKAAQKFVDFLLSRDGQAIVAAEGTLPIRADVEVDKKHGLPPADEGGVGFPGFPAQVEGEDPGETEPCFLCQSAEALAQFRVVETLAPVEEGEDEDGEKSRQDHGHDKPAQARVHPPVVRRATKDEVDELHHADHEDRAQGDLLGLIEKPGGEGLGGEAELVLQEVARVVLQGEDDELVEEEEEEGVEGRCQEGAAGDPDDKGG
jgi:hypothetical protein